MTFNKANIIVFCVFIFSVGACFFVLPRKEVSVAEKRKLASMPNLSMKSYLNGEWSDGVDDYINDQFPLRLELVETATKLKSLKGITLDETEKIVVIKKPDNAVTDSVSGKNNTKTADTVKQNFLTNYEESYSGSMLIINGAVYTLNSGSPKVGRIFGKMLSDYAAELGASTRVFSCVPPLSSAFIPLEKYAKYADRNQNSLLGIREGLTNGALFADVMGELRQHPNEKLFFKTDHHWTPLGAYYGYVAFCKAAGFTAVPREQMEKRVKYNFLGTLYELTRDESVRKNPDTMDYYIPKIEATAERFNKHNFDKPRKSSVFCHTCSGGGSYSTFLCGDIPLIRIKTNVNNGKKAMVIKNSYGNAFSVYLISHYSEIWVMDFRYAEHNILNLLREEKINDLIFAVGMYGAMSEGTIKRMRNLGFNNSKVRSKSQDENKEKKEKNLAADTLKN